jgi:hypothetical protein
VRDLKKTLGKEKSDRTAPGLVKFLKSFTNYEVCCEFSRMACMRFECAHRNAEGSPGYVTRRD